METTNVAVGGLLLVCSALIAVGSGAIQVSLPALLFIVGALGLSLTAVLVGTAGSVRSPDA